MSFTSRSLYREILRRAQTQSILTLAATNSDGPVAEQESATLFAINDALEHLGAHQGDFGGCEECGRRISAERLRTFPWSLRCDKHSDEQIQ